MAVTWPAPTANSFKRIFATVYSEQLGTHSLVRLIHWFLLRFFLFPSARQIEVYLALKFDIHCNHLKARHVTWPLAFYWSPAAYIFIHKSSVSLSFYWSHWYFIKHWIMTWCYWYPHSPSMRGWRLKRRVTFSTIKMLTIRTLYWKTSMLWEL